MFEWSSQYVLWVSLGLYARIQDGHWSFICLVPLGKLVSGLSETSSLKTFILCFGFKSLSCVTWLWVSKNSFFSFFKDFIFLLINWLIDWLLCWVFVSVLGLSLAVASGGHSSSRCAGLPPPRPLPLRSTGSRRAGSAIVAHGPSRSAACGILPDQGSNPCPLH